MFLIRTSLRSPRFGLNPAVSVIQNCGMSKDSLINDDFKEYSLISDSEAPDDSLSKLASRRQKMENTFTKR